MSDTKQTAPLRLVPLVQAASDVGQQSRVLTLAAEGKIRLYVSMPLEKVAYAGSAKLSVSNRMTPAMQTKLDEAKRKGIPVITNPTLCSEIDFLALAPKDARHLLTARFVHARWFPGGLKAAPNEIAQKQGGLEFVPAPLCLCAESAIVGRGPVIVEALEHAIKVDLRDVLVDELITAQLPLSADSEEEDRFQLRSRAPAVFVLYVAAKHFSGGTGSIDVDQKAVSRWFEDRRVPVIDWILKLSSTYEKLTTEANTRLAHKLINPKNDERKWAGSEYVSKPLSPKILEQASTYRFDNYISQRLSVVALAVDRWEQLTKPDPARKRTALTAEHQVKLIEQLRRDLRSWGFDSIDEQNAIVDFVIWPTRIVALNKEIKDMKSEQSNRAKNAKCRPISP